MVGQAVYKRADGFGFRPSAREQYAVLSVVDWRGPGTDVGGSGLFALAWVQIRPLGCEISVEGGEGGAV